MELRLGWKRGAFRFLGSSVAALVLVATGLAGLSFFAASPVAAATTNSLTQSAVAPSVPQINASACPSTTTCYEVGSTVNDVAVVLATTDGGVTWSSQKLPSGTPGLQQISCPTVSDCYAVSSTSYAGSVTMISTTDGGSTWTRQTLPYGAVAEISCPTASDCYISGWSWGSAAGTLFDWVAVTTNGGASWSTKDLPSSLQQSPASITCPTATTCYVVLSYDHSSPPEGVAVTTDSGATWTVKPLPSGYAGAAIACPSATTCYATNVTNYLSGLAVTTNEGSTWSVENYSFPASVNSLSCPTTSECYASGGNWVAIITNAGSSVSYPQLPTGTGSLMGITCPTLSSCYALEGFYNNPQEGVLYTSDGGTSWALSLLPGINAFSDIACPTVFNCYAVSTSLNGTIYMTADAGSTWTTASPPPGNAPLSAISCPAVSDCYAVGNILASNNATMVKTTNSGTTWTAVTLPKVTPSLSLYAISCPTVSDCYAVGEKNTAPSSSPPATILITTNGGASWTMSNLPMTFLQGVDNPYPMLGSAASISCPSATECLIAASGFLAKTSNGGTTWVTSSAPISISALTCPTNSNCYAAGSTTCSSSCLPGPQGNARYSAIASTTDGGSSWSVTSQQVPPSGINSSLAGISCPSALNCYAVSSDGSLVGTVNGVTWQFLAGPSSGIGITSLACPSSSECFATGKNGTGIVGNGIILSDKNASLGLANDPYFTTTSLPNGTAGVPYSATLTAAGGTAPYTWSGIMPPPGAAPPPQCGCTFGLPPGLTLNPTTGVISGTPTAASKFLMELVVTDANGHSNQYDLSITIKLSTPAPTITTTALPAATVGNYYFAKLSMSGGQSPFTWSILQDPLPPGLSLNPSTGVISGTPTTAGYSLFDVGLADPYSFTSQWMNIEVVNSLGATTVQPACDTGLIGAPTSSGGYLMAASNGTVYSCGGVPLYGSMGGKTLNAPVVGIATTPQGGYYEVASDGGIFAFGPGANYYGSMGGKTLNAPLVGIATTPQGGYYEVASDGTVFPFGPGASFYGSVGATATNSHIVAMTLP